MRGVYVIVLCGVVAAIGWVLFGRQQVTLPNPPASPPGDATGQSASTGLTCIQDALGGASAFAGVSSLRIVGNADVTAAPGGLHPVPHKLEIGVQFPDRYRYLNEGTGPHATPLTIMGFNGAEFLTNLARPPESAIPGQLRGTWQGFVRQLLMRLPRELPEVRLTQRTTSDGGKSRVAIDAAGPDGLIATLIADAKSCVPVGMEYGKDSKTAYRLELSDYRRFGGILFPTTMRTARNGEPWEDEHDTEIQVNPAFDADYFRNKGR